MVFKLIDLKNPVYKKSKYLSLLLFFNMQTLF